MKDILNGLQIVRVNESTVAYLIYFLSRRAKLITADDLLIASKEPHDQHLSHL